MSATVPDRKSRHVTGRDPVMKETKYDATTSGQLAAVLGLGLLGGVLIAVWLMNRLPDTTPKPVLLATGDGGWEDGEPDETLDVESPEDPTDDPSLSNDQQESQLEQITEQVMTLSESAAMVQPNAYTDPSGGGNPGSAEGSGGRPYGSGGPGKGGHKRENRWVVEFSDKGNLKSYGAQLDAFNIELGCAFPDGRIFYASKFSTGGVSRRSTLSAADTRLFMNWQGGDRIQADRELLTSAGVPDVAQGTILHFYDPKTEEMMARMEMDYGGVEPDKIRRTYFRTRKSGSSYEFYVTRQKLK